MPGVSRLGLPSFQRAPPIRSTDRLSTLPSALPSKPVVRENAVSQLPGPAVAVELQVAQLASLGTKRSSRPSTAYAQGHERPARVRRTKGEAVPGLGGKPKRPKSMSHIRASVVAPVVVPETTIFARPPSFVPPSSYRAARSQIVSQASTSNACDTDCDSKGHLSSHHGTLPAVRHPRRRLCDLVRRIFSHHCVGTLVISLYFVERRQAIMASEAFLFQIERAEHTFGKPITTGATRESNSASS